jgi:hypothetical protein
MLIYNLFLLKSITYPVNIIKATKPGLQAFCCYGLVIIVLVMGPKIVGGIDKIIS